MEVNNQSFLNAEPNVTFEEWLNIDASEYTENDIDELGLSVRSNNCLRRAKCHSVADILSLKLHDFLSIRNLGRKSADEVVHLVKEYVVSCANIKNNAGLEPHDEPDLHAAINCDGLRPEMKNLLDAVSKHISELNYSSDEYESVAEFLLSLLPDSFRGKFKLTKEMNAFLSRRYYSRPEMFVPASIRDLPLKPFLMAYSAIDKELPSNVKNEDNETVFTWISKLKHEEKEVLIEFIKWICQDVNLLIEKVFDANNYDERELFILGRRASGKTLEEIGQEVYITRERVRQIEKKCLRRFVFVLRANNFIPYLFAVLGTPASITRVAASQFMSEEQVNLLWWAIKNSDEKYDLNCSLSEEHESIVLNTENKQIIAQIDEAIAALPDIIKVEEMDSVLYDMSIDRGYDINLLLNAVSKRYVTYPEVYSARQLSLTDMVEYLMKAKYTNGIHITNDAGFAILVNDLRTSFAVTDNISHNSAINIVNKVGILCEPGTYIAPTYVNVDADVLKDVNDYLERQVSRTTISYNELFERFKGPLENAGIMSPFLLHGLLAYYGCPYSIGKDYVYKSEERNFDDDFIDYVKESYPVSVSALTRHFVLSDAQCRQVIDRCKPLIIRGSMVFYRP